MVQTGLHSFCKVLQTHIPSLKTTKIQHDTCCRVLQDFSSVAGLCEYRPVVVLVQDGDDQEVRVLRQRSSRKRKTSRCQGTRLFLNKKCSSDQLIDRTIRAQVTQQGQGNLEQNEVRVGLGCDLNYSSCSSNVSDALMLRFIRAGVTIKI